MEAGPVGSEPINSYALVAYIRGPLAGFIDNLRAELVCGCDVRAHVTILPPRPLNGDAEQAKRMIAEVLSDYPVFSIEATRIDVFDRTWVIYADIGPGSAELEQLHDALNRGALYQSEQYDYHPHLTLAQNLSKEQSDELAAVARQRWAEFQESREFTVDRLTFVQNTTANQWLDLTEYELSREALEPVG